jgi:predicted XRE-type DNA-binding protein
MNSQLLRSNFSEPSPPEFIFASLAQSRAVLPPAEFRDRLRCYLLDHPELTLAQAAIELGVTRHRVSLMVGKLNRPNCAQGPRPAPETEKARRRIPALIERVANGETAKHAAQGLGISLAQSYQLGFRAKLVHPLHGTKVRAAKCNCWRCRRVAGIALPRGPRTGAARQAAVLDWLAWADPDTGEGLRQAEIGKLTGVGQGLVSRIARAAE